MSRHAPWPPRPGDRLPHAADARNVRDKLSTYSLDRTNRLGGPKANGFERILGITSEDIAYLEGAVQTGILLAPISSIRDNSPWGINCVVMIPIRGRGKKNKRVIDVRTVWRLVAPGASPRLVNAYCKP